MCMCFVKKMRLSSTLITAEQGESAQCLLIGSWVYLSTHYAEREEAGEGVSTGSNCFDCKQRIFFSPLPGTVQYGQMVTRRSLTEYINNSEKKVKYLH